MKIKARKYHNKISMRTLGNGFSVSFMKLTASINTIEIDERERERKKTQNHSQFELNTQSIDFFFVLSHALCFDFLPIPLSFSWLVSVLFDKNQGVNLLPKKND